MDNSGKIIWASHNDIQTANIKTAIGNNNFKNLNITSILFINIYTIYQYLFLYK